MNKINNLILTAGPSITDKEIEYGIDAIKNGWNLQHSDYIKKFEDKFGSYVGTRHAVATSSCTGAMHLAMVALGYGPGDEIIIPEITWIATAASVKYVGATPVFCDVDKDSWTMCPNSVEKLITKKTKAIIPVHLYGHPCEMDPIYEIAKKYNLRIIEDAAQSIGSEYKGKKTGSLGDLAAFSFQGAKALVTGEGGMYVSNNDEITERFKFYWDQGRDKNKVLFNLEIGYKYKMSNVQAAIGLAQIERVDEIIEKKIKIFNWYKDRLGAYEDVLKLNVQKEWAKNIYWMTSLILQDKANIERDIFIKKLKERMVDSRPIFYPLSHLPMFKEDLRNKNSYNIGFNGVSLPSGHERTEEEVDYICNHIKEIVGIKNSSNDFVKGWIRFREDVENDLFKAKKDLKEIKIKNEGKEIGSLVAIGYEDIEKKETIELLMKWRVDNINSFPSSGKITFEGTKIWLKNLVLDKKDRILFFVKDNDNNLIGHVGLYRFNYNDKFCEIDNVVRGDNSKSKGLMSFACNAIIDYAINMLGFKDVYLRVLSDNEKAVSFYQKIGFVDILKVPLCGHKEGEFLEYKEIVSDPYKKADKYYITMKLCKK